MVNYDYYYHSEVILKVSSGFIYIFMTDVTNGHILLHNYGLLDMYMKIRLNLWSYSLAYALYK